MSMDSIGIVEEKLSGLSHRSFCHLTSRGTAALYALLKVMRKRTGPGKIIVPAIVCPSVPNAIVYSGYEPVFCEVNCCDLNISAESVSTLLETEKKIKGILAVDLYGHPCDLDTITRIARKHDIFMIEDVAQALGGTYKNKPLGSFGDAAIMSFGHTKIIHRAQAGCVLTDDEDLITSVRQVLKKLPPHTPDIEKRKQLYSKVYYAIQPFFKKDGLDELFTPVPCIFRDIYLYRKNHDQLNAESEIIRAELEKLAGYVEKRRKHADLYRKLLQHKDIIHPEYPFSGGVPWRYCILVKRESAELTDYIRSRGYDISNWYPPVYRWYNTGKKRDPEFFRNSDYIGSHIINLWTEPATAIHKIRTISREIIQFLDRVDP